MKILPVILAAALSATHAAAQEPLRIEGSNTFGENSARSWSKASNAPTPASPWN
jgi:hypothetical protein